MTVPLWIVLRVFLRNPGSTFTSAELERATGESAPYIRIGSGTLNGILTRLKALGWVEALPTMGRRTPYRMTDTGRDAARAAMLDRGESP